jgi:hypothetical protein
MSVSPHRTIYFPLDGFSWNFTLGTSIKSVQKFKSGQNGTKYLVSSTLHEDLHICYSNICHNSSRNKNKPSRKFCNTNPITHFMSNTFFQNSWRLQENYELYGTAGQAIHHKTQHGAKKVRFACQIIKTIIGSVITFHIYRFRPDESWR